MIENIEHSGQLLAVIVSGRYHAPGVNFFTPPELSQQLAYMHHPAGTVITPHVHNPVSRRVQYTQEVLLIKSGKLRVDFYDNQHDYIESRVIEGGDVILLIQGGHGFEVLEEVVMFEVKQGPFVGPQDKTCFEGRLPQRLDLGTKPPGNT